MKYCEIFLGSNATISLIETFRERERERERERKGEKRVVFIINFRLLRTKFIKTKNFGWTTIARKYFQLSNQFYKRSVKRYWRQSSLIVYSHPRCWRQP